MQADSPVLLSAPVRQKHKFRANFAVFFFFIVRYSTDVWGRSLSPEEQQVSEAFKEPPHVCDVEVDVVREVGANVGVSAHQGAVEGGPADADHHGDQAEQQQDQAGISTDLVYKQDVDKRAVRGLCSSRPSWNVH